MRRSMKTTLVSRSRRGEGHFRASLLFVMVLLLGWSQSGLIAQAPDAITVSGAVRNRAGQAVAGAQVLLEDAGTSKNLETTTNADGTFALAVPRAGTYSLRAEKDGVRTRTTEPFVLAAGEKRHFDLVLGASASASSQ